MSFNTYLVKSGNENVNDIDEAADDDQNNRIFQFPNRIVSNTSDDADDVIQKESDVSEKGSVIEEEDIDDNDNTVNEEDDDILSESEVPKPNQQRRFSLGRIPVPPKTLNYDDIKELADQAITSTPAVTSSVRGTVDPRRSSVTPEIYKNFKESNRKKKTTNDEQIVYVETKGRFKAMRKGTFNIERILEKEREDEIEKQRNFYVPIYLQDIAQAYHSQRSINQFALIVQGFLAGISVTLAVFAFNFTKEALFRNYQWMSLPVHSIFMVAFSIGLLTAIDRLGIYKSQHFYAKKHLKGVLANNGLLGFIIWSIGLISTLLCIRFDSSLFRGIQPDDQSIYFWRACCIIRAITAATGWLLLAFKPDSDVVARQLKNAVLDSIKLDRSNTKENISEKREIILKSLNMS